ncbi:hypothetical protein DVH05_016925 [Phytophthora capsici]|nr:hypothetical protein DVH05_016925 [Phytophthora capsici]
MSLKPEVDSMLRGGAGPKRIRLLLLKKYKKDKVKQAKIPDEIMLKIRKASLKKSSKNAWEISNFTVMMEWASPQMCTDPEVFFGWMGGFDVQNDKHRWTLVCFGTACGVYDNHTYRRSFVPWVYMFVRTKHE